MIDFSWFYFIGTSKLNLTYEQISHMSVTLFFKLYRHYKANFDLEMRLKLANKTYREVERIKK